MVRLILIIVIVALILAAWIFPRFRRIIWGVLGVGICVVSFIIWFDTQERKLEESRFSTSKAELLSMEAHPGLQSGSYIVTGRIRNNSQDFTITTFILQLTLNDCRSNSCETIGQEDGRVFLEVPPGQSRDFNVSIPFTYSMAVQGNPEWIYEVVRIQGR